MQGTGRTPALVAVALTAVLTTQVSCRSVEGPAADAPVDPCPAPDASAIRQDAARSTLVARVEPIGRPKISDGVTTGEGLLARVGKVLAGAPASGDIAVWPDISTPSEVLLAEGETLIVFLAKHSRATTADGNPVTGYDIAVANGLLAQRGSTIARLCKGNRSGTADAGVLDEL